MNQRLAAIMHAHFDWLNVTWTGRILAEAGESYRRTPRDTVLQTNRSLLRAMLSFVESGDPTRLDQMSQVLADRREEMKFRMDEVQKAIFLFAEVVLDLIAVEARPDDDLLAINRDIYAALQEAVVYMSREFELQSQKRILNRYFAPSVVQRLLRGDEDPLRTREDELTVMFTDIRGFTALSEKLDRKLLIELLNIYFERMTEIVFEFGGTIDKFIGDAMMVFFGAPDPMPLPEQSIRAVRMALRMMSALDELQATSPALRRNPVAIGIGINSGHVTIGNIGSEGRMDYTVMGTPVNLAARLEQTAGPRQILVSTPTLSHIEGLVKCEDLGLRLFKNISQPVQVFNITGVRDTATDQPVPELPAV